MPRVRTGPLTGLIVQLVLLETLAKTVGLDRPGWFAGTGYGIATCAALSLGLGRSGAAGLAPADRVTLARCTLVGCVTALVADSFHRTVPVVLLVALATAALSLDWVDGQVARRTGTATELGARFDMEVDASLLLVLSAYAAGTVGVWALSIGLMRYAFVLAMWVLPWMRGTLPPRYWRKVVAATQGIVLVAATSGVPPRAVTVAALAGAVVLLVESFGRDVCWLWRHRLVAASDVGRGRRASVPA